MSKPDKPEFTPLAMLQQYRDNADPFIGEQARLFGLLSPGQQRELLFWMAMHNAVLTTTMRGPTQ